MKLIIIYGAPAVGKLTTASLLSEKTGYPVLHNHATIDTATNYFPFGSKPFFRLIRKLRLSIIQELLAEKVPGLIWTTGLPNTPDNKAFYKMLDSLVTKNGGVTYYIKLLCNPKEQKRRVVNKGRAKYKKLNTHVGLKRMMQSLDFSTETLEKKTLIIDNTEIPVSKAVSKIMRFIS